MASATVTAHHHQSSFSAPSSATVQPSSDHGANNLSTAPMPSQSQPSSSSQQSFAGPKMSLSQSSQPGLAASAAAGAYRQSQSQSQPQHHQHQHLHQHQHHQSQPPMYDPGVYLAVYSGIEVYEMEVNNVHVMRRRKDGWLNATQILKVAGVDKGKRTKILEKEIQTGEHEKVQGGYGKYQGTWINYDRGVEVCRQYGVEDVLRGLLTYNIGETLDPNLNTPTKEQAMAAQRKRMYNAAAQEGRPQQQPGTFFRNISTTASTALSAINKARSPANRPGYANSMRAGSSNLSRAPSFNRQPSNNGQQEDTPMNSQQSYLSHSQDFDGAFSQPGSQQQQQQQAGPDGLPEPPRKRQRILTPAGSFGPGSLQYDPTTAAYANEYPGSPTEPNESFIYTQAGLAPPDSQQPLSQQQPPQYEPLPPLPMDMSPEAQHKRSILMSLFMEPGGNNAEDTAKYNHTLRSMSPQDLDMPIDNHCHTSLHWAATLSRTGLLRALISSGASPYRVNASGETALMRAALVTNSMEFSTFPDLLDLLGTTIDVVDNKGRTVLHHIAVASAVKGRNAASKYYLESLLEWVVRQGSAPNSAPSSSQPSPSQPPPQKPRMNLRRFMDEIVNAQDKSGDTALNIAARIGNRSIISQLIEVGADFTIANRAGLRPQDFGVGAENGEDEMNQSAIGGGASQPQGNSQQAKQSSDDIVTSITALLSETSSNFQSELKSKQRNVDSLTASIRTVSASVADSRKTLEAKQSQLRLQQLARQRMVNYSRANEEEKFRLADLERAHPRADPSAVEKWKVEPSDPSGASVGPSVLRARIKGLKARTEAMQRATAGLQGRSKDVELKYRKVVSLCTGAPEGEVEGVIDSLLRAVESEKGELELGRVRRFLGGVETVG